MKCLSLLLSLLVSLLACQKVKEFPNTPQITYKDFTQIKNKKGIDSIGVLKFYFTDGDGDFGLRSSDTIPPFDKKSVYYYNLYIYYYEKQKGEFKLVPLTLENHVRLPYMTPAGQNKALEGDISVKIFTNNPFSVYDTIKFKCFVYDRALNKSNEIETPEIIITKK